MAVVNQKSEPSAPAAVQTQRVAGELSRYLVVALVALAADFGVLVGMREIAGWHYLASAAAGFAFGLTTSYLLSVAWVFSHRIVHNRLAEFTLFAMIGLTGVMMTEAILYCGTDLCRLDYRVSKIMAVGCVFVWNFGARKLILFRG
jgi:putative flippase GtrA